MSPHVAHVWLATCPGPVLDLSARAGTVAELLARALGRRTGEAVLRRLPGGKPVLADGGAHVSVAHTGPHVLVAVTSPAAGPLGVDAEQLRQLDVDLVARAVLAPAERDRLAVLPVAEHGAALLRAWTRKEALLKADGIGLARRPETLEVELVPGHATTGRARPVQHSAGPPWHLYDVAVDGGLLAALATAVPVSVRLHDARPAGRHLRDAG